MTELFGRAQQSWGRAHIELARGLRDARQLHSRERRAVSDALHDMTRMRRRLAFAAGLDHGEHATPSADTLYLAYLAQQGSSEELTSALASARIDAGKLANTEERLFGIEDPIRRLALTHSYPDWLVSRFVDEQGIATTALLLAASNHRAPLCARANRLKNDRVELAALLAKEGIETRPLELTPDGLELLTHHNAYGLATFREGRFELQDTASQLVGEVVAPPPRGRVLDLCAGAGGKTLHLAALLQGAGRVTSCDVIGEKLEELRKRARRAGCSNVEARRIDREGPLRLDAPYDRVLVDAPCTGTGVLRRNPEARWRLGPKDVLELPQRQLEILERAAPLVKPDGRLIFATCSLLRAENDGVLASFLERNRGFDPVLLKEILGKDRAMKMGDGTVLRTDPAHHAADGFFAAVLRRTK
ncbi:MAG: methyltransferase domain-containing protein [Polyangia bacterium]